MCCLSATQLPKQQRVPSTCNLHPFEMCHLAKPLILLAVYMTENTCWMQVPDLSHLAHWRINLRRKLLAKSDSNSTLISAAHRRSQHLSAEQQIILTGMICSNLHLRPLPWTMALLYLHVKNVQQEEDGLWEHAGPPAELCLGCKQLQGYGMWASGAEWVKQPWAEVT